MSTRLVHFIRFTYTLSVFAVGLYLSRQLPALDIVPMLGVGAVVSAGMTWYFARVVQPRIDRVRERGGSDAATIEE